MNIQEARTNVSTIHYRMIVREQTVLGNSHCRCISNEHYHSIIAAIVVLYTKSLGHIDSSWFEGLPMKANILALINIKMDLLQVSLPQHISSDVECEGEGNGRSKVLSTCLFSLFLLYVLR